jgi:heat shock protein HtpX
MGMTSARSRSRYVPDRGLATRMVTTMFLIGLLYVVFVGVLLVLLRDSWPVVLLIAGGLFVVQFWFSDRIAAYSMGAREVTPEQAPELHGAVDRICALADMPKPRVAIADSDVPNAFATGRNQNCATNRPPAITRTMGHESRRTASRTPTKTT